MHLIGQCLSWRGVPRVPRGALRFVAGLSVFVGCGMLAACGSQDTSALSVTGGQRLTAPDQHLHRGNVVVSANQIANQSASQIASPNTTENWRWAVAEQLVRERVIGLLNIPDVIGGGCGPSAPKTIALYPTPSARQPPLGSVQYLVTDRQPDGLSCGTVQLVLTRTTGATEEMPSDESGYEIGALVVLERSGSWFRIALQKGSAWVSRDDSMDFDSYPALLQGHLAYVRKGWDGRLWARPNAGTATQVPDVWNDHLNDQVHATVLEVQTAGDQLWLHVRLETEVCGEAIPNVVPVTGWLPAYRASGATSAWFHSRGC